MNPHEEYLRYFHCTTFQELHSMLKLIAKNKMGLDRVPFPVSALEHPPDNIFCPEVHNFIMKSVKAYAGDNSEADAIKLIKRLKGKPPKVSYINPKLSEAQPTKDEWNLKRHIFLYGIDLPGSMFNPFGHLQHFSSFFIDMFVGNFTDFNGYIKTLSKEEVQRALKKREGYCQYSPIFAPILGMKMVNIEECPIFTSQQVQEIRTMYSRFNENMHLEICKKLVKLGADVNAHDINGFTPLHHAAYYRNEGIIKLLLSHGANPNSESRTGWLPLTCLTDSSTESEMKCIDLLIHHYARVTDKEEINTLRTSVETHGTKDLAVKVREAHPREVEECEKCVKYAIKKCSSCKTVYYCSPACQKLDWKFHGVSCRKQACAIPTHAEVD